MPTANDWLLFAKSDLKAARILIHMEQPPLAIALFYGQQCVEKSLKAYLVHENIAPKKTTCLVKLVKCCTRINSLFATILHDASDINQFSGSICYPSDTQVLPELDTALHIIEKAASIYEFIEILI